MSIGDSAATPGPPAAARGPGMSQFFHVNPVTGSRSGPKPGPWRRDLPRTWRAALDLPDVLPEAPAPAGGIRLGPDDGTLSLRTTRTGAAAKAGHDLLIHVTQLGGHDRDR